LRSQTELSHLQSPVKAGNSHLPGRKRPQPDNWRLGINLKRMLLLVCLLPTNESAIIQAHAYDLLRFRMEDCGENGFMMPLLRMDDRRIVG
jgi:hypothetical protein